MSVYIFIIFRGHKNVVWCFALYKERLFSSGGDSLVKVWDLDVLTNGCIKTMEGHTGVVSNRELGNYQEVDPERFLV